MKKIAIRFDDVCESMDIEKFNKIINIIEKYNIKPLIGIIPENLDKKLIINHNSQKEFSSLIFEMKSKGFLFAQHGLNHVYVNENSGILGINKKSEFAGLSYEEQYEKIKKGKTILENKGVYSNIFMAPSHSFDKNTLKALKDNDFMYVTDGYTSFNYMFYNLIFIPCMHSCTAEKATGVITLCIHSNTLSDKGIIEFSNFLENNKNSLVDYNELLKLDYRKKFRLIQFINLFKFKSLRSLRKLKKKLLSNK